MRLYVNGVQQGPGIKAFSQKEIIASGGLGCRIAAHKLYAGYHDALMKAKEKIADTNAAYQGLLALEKADFKCDQTLVQAIPPMSGPAPVRQKRDDVLSLPFRASLLGIGGKVQIELDLRAC